VTKRFAIGLIMTYTAALLIAPFAVQETVLWLFWLRP
jgi:hypothetical protein